MAMIRIGRFGGIAPLHEPRQLPPPYGTQAIDVRFLGGALRPLELDVGVFSISFEPSHLMFTPLGPVWWPASAGEVSSVRSPIPDDPHRRLYWTQTGGDARPQIAVDQSGPISLSRALGIPAPSAAPQVSEATTTADAIGRGTSTPITAMSNTAPITVTANNHPFEDGQRVVVSFPAFPPEEDDINLRELSGREFLVGSVTSSTFTLRGADGTQMSAFNASEPPTIRRVYSDVDMVSRSYVFCLVSVYGEEGPPSPPSAVRDVRYNSRVTVTATNVPIATGYNPINRVRVYRAAAGTDRAGFFFVKEVGVDPPPGLISFSVVDDITEDQASIGGTGAPSTVTRVLGELLPSTGWTPPPTGLRGLVQMPNGFLCGFKGNTLYFSEPYLPHAWPDAYRKTTNTEIRGLAVFGQTLVVATAGKPYIAYGTDAASVTLQELDVDAACVLGASVCSIGAGVAYASHDGLVVIGPGGSARNVTESLFTKAQWRARVPALAQAAFADRRYVMISRTAGQSWFIEFGDGGVNFSELTIAGRALAINSDDDTLNFAAAPTFMSIVRHAVGGARLTARWRSGVFTLPRPADFSAGQLFASSYPVTLTLRRAIPTTAGGAPPVSPNDSTVVSVTGPDPFRLPARTPAREWLVEVDPNGGQVFEVVLAESMEELRQT